MNGIVSTVIKLALACFVVGLVLHFFNIDPVRLMQNLPDTVYAVFDLLLGWTRNAVPYIMLGAIVVIPILCVSAPCAPARARAGPCGPSEVRDAYPAGRPRARPVAARAPSRWPASPRRLIARPSPSGRSSASPPTGSAATCPGSPKRPRAW